MKQVLVVLVVGAGLVGLAFATGVIQSGADPEAQDPAAGSNAGGGDLESLAYVGAVDMSPKDRKKKGVVRHDQEKAAGEYFLYTPCGWGKAFRQAFLKAGQSQPFRETRLLNNNGEVVHTWTHQYPNRGGRGWANAKLGPDGHLHAIRARTGLVKLDWESNLVWGRSEFYHHDLDFGDDGTVYALIETRRDIEHNGKPIRILDNGIAFITPQGELSRIIWLYDGLASMPALTARLDRLANGTEASQDDPVDDAEEEDHEQPASDHIQLDAKLYSPQHKNQLRGRDAIHANTIEVLRAPVEGLWDQGDLLTCSRSLDSVVVIDRETGLAKWHWGANTLDRPHDPSLLDNGNLLIFDNGWHRKYSRVIELDPKTGKIVWKYEGTNDDPFFTYMRGQATRMPNDNTFIVSSQRGRAFEVTRDGEIVWEFFGPDTSGRKRVPIRIVPLLGAGLDYVKKQLSSQAAGA